MDETAGREAYRSANLSQISTRWPLLSDPVQFAFRYAEPIHRYLAAIIKDSHDAEEVLQDFLLRAFEHGIVPASAVRGKFRYYLKAAVRNAALTHFRRQEAARHSSLEGIPPPAVESADAMAAEADQRWIAQWRQCVLDRVWQALDHHQRRSPDNLSYTVLRLVADHPGEDSESLAVKAGRIAGRPIRADAFRQHLSRARRTFARLLVAEVAQTLQEPTPDRVEEELIEIGLMPYLRDLLPPNWKEQPLGPSGEE